MKQPVIYGLVGFDRLAKTAVARSAATHVTFDEAFATLTPTEMRAAALDAMPPGAQAAFLAGPQRGQRPPPIARGPTLAEQAMLSAIAHNPQFTLKAEAQMKSKLSPSEVTTAQGIFAQMAAPLSAGEREVCRQLGTLEDRFKAQRDENLAAALPGVVLTEDERKLQHFFNLSTSDLLKARG